MTENNPTFDDENDDEYELEPVDPEILEHERKRAEFKTRKAEASVDIDEVFRQTELAAPIGLEDFKHFRFTTRHLLIATALLSVVMTLCLTMGSCMGLFVSGGATIAGGWWFVHQRERRHAEKMEQQRRETEARMAAERAAEDGQARESVPLPASLEIDTAWDVANDEPPSFDFSFSLKEFFGAFTTAAVILALVKLTGPQTMALVLGLTALLGLVLHATGFDPPRVIILGWWILLLMYLLVGLFVAFGSDPAPLSSTVPNGMGPNGIGNRTSTAEV